MVKLYEELGEYIVIIRILQEFRYCKDLDIVNVDEYRRYLDGKSVNVERIKDIEKL